MSRGGAVTWVKIDENAPNHPKFFRAGHAAIGFWLGCLAYCSRYLTDGCIPEHDLRLVFPGTPPDVVTEMTEVLVREGLLEVVDKGYRMHDYLDWQRSKKETIGWLKGRKTAGRKGGRQSGEARRALRDFAARQGGVLLPKQTRFASLEPHESVPRDPLQDGGNTRQRGEARASSKLEAEKNRIEKNRIEKNREDREQGRIAAPTPWKL